MQDPLLQDLSPYDIILEQMEDYIEYFCDDREGVDVDSVEYFDVFPEEDPNGFDRFLARARKGSETLDEAYKLAREWMAAGGVPDGY